MQGINKTLKSHQNAWHSIKTKRWEGHSVHELTTVGTQHVNHSSRSAHNDLSSSFQLSNLEDINKLMKLSNNRISESKIQTLCPNDVNVNKAYKWAAAPGLGMYVSAVTQNFLFCRQINSVAQNHCKMAICHFYIFQFFFSFQDITYSSWKS